MSPPPQTLTEKREQGQVSQTPSGPSVIDGFELPEAGRAVKGTNKRRK